MHKCRDFDGISGGICRERETYCTNRNRLKYLGFGIGPPVGYLVTTEVSSRDHDQQLLLILSVTGAMAVQAESDRLSNVQPAWDTSKFLVT
jgi:hypothetical protein